MKLAAIVLLASLASATPLTSKSSADFCYPGQSCYPSLKELSHFNQTVGGRLFSQVPIEAVCYESE